MYFNSFEYILFLWAVYVVFWTLKERRKLRFSFAVIASYWFYAQADWRFTFLLFTSTVVDFVAARAIEREDEAGERKRKKLILGLSLTANLGMLGFFKYFDFFVDSFEALFARFGADVELWHLSIAVPAGISFYTFQSISYVVDVYYRRIEPCKSPIEYALFVSFFPMLVAGPIVRARDFLPQLRAPRALTRERVSKGLWEILRGMAKKLVIADVLGAHLVDHVYHDAASLSAAGGLGVLVATYAFTMQLYGDFAGYSDIAIGSARLLGFDLRKNFDAPFKSRSLEEFWTRWHISMSFWFYYYVFASLGGNKRGLARTCANLFITHLASGVWHGAGWNYVLWGVWFGVWMVAVRLIRQLLPNGVMPRRRIFSFLGWLFTYHVCAGSLVFFRASDTESVIAALRALADWGGPLPDVLANLPWQIWVVLVGSYIACVWPESWNERLLTGWLRVPSFAQGAVLALALLFFLGVAPPGLAAFIYFQF